MLPVAITSRAARAEVVRLAMSSSLPEAGGSFDVIAAVIVLLADTAIVLLADTATHAEAAHMWVI
ncbi:MAG: hypothetical protein LC749_03570 [Actinobacteria bacterium]|nr:hypothetical protein [Actinomycetota bacterium]